MKKLFAACALALASLAAAAGSCGVPPVAPDGMRFVCVCAPDPQGFPVCNWVLISRLSQFYDWELV